MRTRIARQPGTVKLIAHTRMFRFEDRDVEAMTTTKPIEFLPA